MAIYSIKDLEDLSGIKAHTLRIWEQRYGIIEPKRTPTNIRYYDDEDLRAVLNIALLNQKGLKISKIATLSKEELTSEAAKLADVNAKDSSLLDAMTMAMKAFDSFKFEKIVSAHIDGLGFHKTMTEVLFPFLEKFGALWVTGAFMPAHEHFVVNIIRRKLTVAIDSLSDKQQGGQLYLLYLPQGETQDLPLLFMDYVLKNNGFNTIYLGPDIPYEDVFEVYNAKKPEHVFTIISDTFFSEPVKRYVDRLCEHCAESTVWLSGYAIANRKFQLPHNAKVLDSLRQV